MFGLPTEIPQNWYDPMLLAGILSFFAFFTWLIMAAKESGGGAAPWRKWLSLIILAPALYDGLRNVSFIREEFYRSAIVSKKMVYAHHLSLAMPIIVLLFMVGHALYLRSAASNRREAPEE